MKRDHLTPAEIDWLDGHPLARLATVDAHAAPQNNPVSAYYNRATGTIDIGGHAMTSSRKYRNALLPGARAAVVVDEMRDGDPTTIRLLEVRGPIVALEHPADSAARMPGAILRITPATVISWGLEPPR